MKKLLIATTSLAFAGLATPNAAVAAEKIALGLGGFMEHWVGYADQEGSFESANGADYGEFDEQSDSEVHFYGATALENGLEVSVVMTLEADVLSGGNIDNSFLQVVSSYGIVQLGGVGNALWEVHNSAPEVGIENQDGDYGNWIVAPANFVDIGATGADTGASQKINVYSPTFMGFTLAAGYQPDVDNAGSAGPIPNTPGTRSAWAAGIAYGGEYDNGIAVNADFGYAHATGYNTVSSLRGWQGGLVVDIPVGPGTVTVGGGYIHWNHPTLAAATSMEGNAWDAGIAYGTGPWAFSFNGFRSEAEGTPGGGDDVKTSLMLSSSYALGPGVDWKSSLLHVEYDDETSLAANNNEGWGLVSGLALTF